MTGLSSVAADGVLIGEGMMNRKLIVASLIAIWGVGSLLMIGLDLLFSKDTLSWLVVARGIVLSFMVTFGAWSILCWLRAQGSDEGN